MSRHGHKLVCIVVTIIIVVMNFGLWSSLDAPVTYAIPCGVNCENITNTPTVAVILNGVDQTVSYTLAFSLNNVSVLGWNVTITSTQFATGATPVRTLTTTISS